MTIDQTFGNYNKFDIIDGFLTVSTTVSYNEFQSLDVKLIATDAGELSFTKYSILRLITLYPLIYLPQILR